jgi:hypothetical protein
MIYRPFDRGALLDPTTLRWTRLPAPPFTHPTSNPQIAAAAGHLVLVGNSCIGHLDQSLPNDLMGGPDCGSIERLQAASYDVRTGQWTKVSVVGEVGLTVDHLWPVGRRILVVFRAGPGTPENFAIVDPTTGRWKSVAGPTVGSDHPIVCPSKGDLFAIGLTGTETGGFGPLLVSVLRPGAAKWSAPGPGLPTPTANQVVVGCTGDGVLAAATTFAQPLETAGPGDRSTYSYWRPGGPWAPVPAPTTGQPTLQGASPNSPGLFDAYQLERDRVGISVGGAPTTQDDAVFDADTRGWSAATVSFDPRLLQLYIDGAELEWVSGRLGAVTR